MRRQLCERHPGDTHRHGRDRLHILRLEWRRLFGPRQLRRNRERSDDGNPDLHCRSLAYVDRYIFTGRYSGHGGNREQQPIGNQLPSELQFQLRSQYAGYAHRDRGYRVYIRWLEWRRLHRYQHMLCECDFCHDR